MLRLNAIVALSLYASLLVSGASIAARKDSGKDSKGKGQDNNKNKGKDDDKCDCELASNAAALLDLPANQTALVAPTTPPRFVVDEMIPEMDLRVYTSTVKLGETSLSRIERDPTERTSGELNRVKERMEEPPAGYNEHGFGKIKDVGPSMRNLKQADGTEGAERMHAPPVGYEEDMERRVIWENDERREKDLERDFTGKNIDQIYTS
ncbi:hypothetical protein C8F01DRAFT_1092929 [Mycena amicta]|nr:hypothetical protein C8F01DRAFT_1092929 [Mycena amicta]